MFQLNCNIKQQMCVICLYLTNDLKDYAYRNEIQYESIHETMNRSIIATLLRTLLHNWTIDSLPKLDSINLPSIHFSINWPMSAAHIYYKTKYTSAQCTTNLYLFIHVNPIEIESQETVRCRVWTSRIKTK